MHPHNVLVTVTGFDRPGVISALFAAFAAHDVEVLDVEQVVIRGRLVLGVALALHGDPGALRRAATLAAEALGTEIEVTSAEDLPAPVVPRRSRHHVVVLGRPLRAGAVGEIARRIADLGGNVDAISRLGDDRFIGLELMVTGTDHHQLAATLVTVALETGTDIAMERAGLRRRSKRLVLFDADRTLLPTDTLGLLAELAGRGNESARLVAAAREAELQAGSTARLAAAAVPPPAGGTRPDAGGSPRAAAGPARAGFAADGHRPDRQPAAAARRGSPTGPDRQAEPDSLTAPDRLVGPERLAAEQRLAAQGRLAGLAVDGSEAAARETELLRARAALLAGLPVAAMAQVRAELQWAPGADALLARLQRMGYRCGAVSGGAAQVVEPLLDRLGLDFAVANRLEVSGCRLTGRLVDAGLDPASKVPALIRFAHAYGVPLSQTVAVGGLGGIDVLACAGLGLAVGTGAGGGWQTHVGRAPTPRAAGQHGLGTDEVSYAEALLVMLGMPVDAGTHSDHPPVPATDRRYGLAR
jgi:phosphoserine phosphatase/predicted amino acid-binding ACT domain protein